MKQHVLVTGGAGYLGSVLCGVLLQAGYRVTVMDSLIYGQSPLFHLCHSEDFNFVRADVRDEGTLKKLVSGADAIIPLAAIVGAPACDRDPWEATAVNLDAIRLLNKLRSRQQTVVYPVTNSGYGTKSGAVYCTEETPLEPISLYGQTKVDAEAELLAAGNAITLRLATVFGMSPRMRLDLLVNHFTHAALTDGYIVIFERHFKRNFVHIRDVADCFLHALTNREKMLNRPYNVGLDSANISKEELANLIKAHIPRFVIHYDDMAKDPDKRNYIVSNQRLREAGFEAKRSIDDGVRELLKGYAMLARSQYANI